MKKPGTTFAVPGFDLVIAKNGDHVLDHQAALMLG